MVKDVGLFSSLHIPAYRLLWTSVFFVSLCWNIQSVLVSWLVLKTTGSSLMLGLVMALNFAPQAFGAISGTVADRVDKRQMLLLVSAAQVAFSATLGFLVIGGQIQFWQIAVIVFISSTLSSFSQPAQFAYTIDLVGKANTTNAVSLNQLSMFVAGTVGPSLIGAFFESFGMGFFFFLNAAFFSLTILPLLLIRKGEVIQTADETSQGHESQSVIQGIAEGFRFSWKHRIVLGGELVVLITNIFVWPCVWTMTPIFSTDVLGLDASGLGWLTAVNQLGGFLANIVLASREPRHKGSILFVSSFLWGAGWLLFANVPLFPISLASELIVGAASSFTMTLATIVLLMNSEPRVRGRVMGIQTLTVASQSPGSILAGSLAQSLGARMAINVEAVGFIMSMVVLMKVIPEIRKAE